MNKITLSLFLVLCIIRAEAQDTFSIVAGDSLTGEVQAWRFLSDQHDLSPWRGHPERCDPRHRGDPYAAARPE
ncbi:MAG: hypothetical protein MZV63_55385 [Marinilabiliales bacterium]|nr:hypothetical protein [Marinilabiliales bacterium]